MSFASWAGGSLLLALIGTLAGWGTWQLRSGLLPGWTGAPARLAELVTAVATVIGVSQAIGAVGRFDRVTLVLGVAAVAVALSFVAGRRVRPAEGVVPASVPEASGSERLLALIAVAVVAGQWSSFTLQSLREGVLAADSIWYHLPRAARFATTGWVTRLHYTAPEFPDTFHPANGELVHAIPMLAYQRDALAPVVNLGWLAAVLLAAWCIGRPFGRASLSLAGVAALLATPLLVIEGAGNAGNDLAAAFFLLAAVAILVQPRSGIAPIALAGVAAGMAMSTKLTVVPLVVVLTVGVVWAGDRQGRAGRALAWVAGALPFGSYWYVRNWIEVGSPVPATNLPFFPSPRFQIVEEAGFTVADYVGDWDVIRDWFLPGLRGDFGLAWPLVLAVLGSAIILAIAWRGSVLMQVAGVALAVATATYLVLPTTALGPPGRPFLFAGNVVYLEPALLLAAALLPVLVMRRWPRAGWLAAGVSAVVLVIGPVTSPLRSVASGWEVSAVVAAAIVIVVGGALLIRPLRGASVGLSLALIGVTALVGGYGLAEGYTTDRYRDHALYAWEPEVSGARIAIAGFGGQFPLFGAALDNEVEYVGRTGEHGEFHDLRQCEAWRSRLRSGGYDYVVLKPERFDTDRYHLLWTTSDPAATLVHEALGGSVYRFDPAVPDPGCQSDIAAPG